MPASASRPVRPWPSAKLSSNGGWSPTGSDDGVRFVNGVDVVTLAELAPAVRQVPDLYDAYTRQAGPVDLPSFLTTLATAVARGWLRAGLNLCYNWPSSHGIDCPRLIPGPHELLGAERGL